MDEITGMLIDIAILKQVAQERIIDVLDHHDIVRLRLRCFFGWILLTNVKDEDVAYFFKRPSTLENLVVFVWQEVRDGLECLGVAPNLLHEVEIYETQSNSITYRGERSGATFDR